MKQLLFLSLGLVTSSCGLKVILALHLNVGGGAGLSAILQDTIGLPFVVSSLMLSLLPLIWKWKKDGIETTLKTFGCIVAFSMLMDYGPSVLLPVEQMNGGMKCAVASIAAVVTGGGFGIVLNNGKGSTGGSDLVSEMINYYLPQLSRGLISTTFNCAVVVATAFLYGMKEFLVSVIITIMLNESVNLTFYIGSNKQLPKSLQLIGNSYRKIASTWRRKTTFLSTRTKYRRLQNGDVLIAVLGTDTVKLQVIEVKPK